MCSPTREWGWVSDTRVESPWKLCHCLCSLIAQTHTDTRPGTVFQATNHVPGVIKHEVDFLLVDGVSTDAGDCVKVVVLVAVQEPEAGWRARHGATTSSIHLHQICTVHFARDHNYDSIKLHHCTAAAASALAIIHVWSSTRRAQIQDALTHMHPHTILIMLHTFNYKDNICNYNFTFHEHTRDGGVMRRK